MRADLFHDEGGFTPRPAWQVIEAARRRALTGELTLATAPATHVYLRDGQVYFAERSTDSGIGVRLLVDGVITRQQLGKGAIVANGIEHLGRMFDRDHSIDRQTVELAVEMMTDETLVAIADEQVTDYRLTLYRRHPSGIDRWIPNRVEIVTHVVESSRLDDDVAAPALVPAGAANPPAPIPAPTPTPAATAPTPVMDEPAAPVRGMGLVEPLRVAPLVPSLVPLSPHPTLANEADTAAHMEPTVIERLANHLRDYSDDPDATPVMGTPLPTAPQREVFTNPSANLAQSAVDAIVTSGLADEVAQAVREALQAIDAAAQPEIPLSPADFDPERNPLLSKATIARI